MNDMLHSVGGTPVVLLRRISRLAGANIYAKMESCNPGLSIKDRVAIAYIEGALRRGELARHGCVVEAADGPLALSLAHTCLQYDLQLMLCLPASASRYLLHTLREMGVHIFLSPAEEGMEGARALADYHHKDTWGSFRPAPAHNPDGPACYEQGLGEELVADARALGIHWDAFICSVDSGATLTGTGRRLRREWPDIHLVAARRDGRELPEGGVLDGSLLSTVLDVSADEARDARRRLLGMEALRACDTAGAHIHAALLLARRPGWQRRNLLTIIPHHACAVL